MSTLLDPSELNCINPTLIVSPTLDQDILKCDKFYRNGELVNITPKMRACVLAGDSASRILHLPFIHTTKVIKVNGKYEYFPSMGVDDPQSFFMVSSDDATIFPCYQFVPCGKCDACYSKKVNSIIQRCKFQSLQDGRVPLFVTLTYNTRHLPKDGICLRDVQLFKKRFRTWYQRIYNRDPHELRFFITSEYGKKGLKRPHYHCMIFGWSADDPVMSPYHQWEERLRFIQFCWREPRRFKGCRNILERYRYYKKLYPVCTNLPADYDLCSYGFVNLAKDVNSSSSVAEYVSKYITKGCDIPAGFNPPFRPLMSPHMGVEFVSRYKDTLKDGKFKYFNSFDCSVQDCNLSTYYLKKIFPSLSQLIPSDFRKSYFSLLFNLRIMSRYSLKAFNQLNKFKNIKGTLKALHHFALNQLDQLHKHFPFMSILDTDFSDFKKPSVFIDFETFDGDGDFISSSDDLFSQVIQDLHNVYSYEIDIDFVNKLIADRDKFFESFKSNTQPAIVASRYRQRINVSRSKAKL